MQAELQRCISTAQRALSSLKLFAPPNTIASPDSQASSLLASIASSGIPRIDDSRVPTTLNAKLHEATEEHFQKACLLLQETHPRRTLASLQSVALQLRAIYIEMYERQVVKAASMQRRSLPAHRQPFANDVLLYAFEQSQTPSRRERQRLATLTGLTVEQVRVWFQNRRSRIKKKAPELQQRQPMPLSDLLERVVTSNRAAKVAERECDEGEYEDDALGNVNCAYSESPPQRDQTVPLALANMTARSYPATYSPQPLVAEFCCERPTWPRQISGEWRAASSTVTVDELARSMARLTLRHRRLSPRSSHSPAFDAASGSQLAPAPALPASSTKKPNRRDAETGRRIAGARRAGSSSAATALPQRGVVGTQLSAPALAAHAAAATAPARARKSAGLPRRNPVTKALARQASDSSIVSSSSCSTTSSRSTSCASDFSFCSASSDSSSTSVESLPAMSNTSNCQLGFDLDTEFASSSHPLPDEHAQVPVYDLSALAPDFPGLSALLNNPDAIQMSQVAHAQQHEVSLCNSALVDTSHAGTIDHHMFDIGVGNMDAFLDFSSSAYTNLEALLSDDSLVPQHHAVFGPQPPSQQHNLDWRTLPFLMPTLA